MDPRDGETLALLVHKGFLDADQARRAMSERSASESFPQVVARLGFLPGDEAERLWDNRVGEEPKLTRYRLTKRLGSGGTAIVFEAEDLKEGGKVALKVLREEYARVRARLERFVAEAKLLCDLEHDGLVKGLRVAKDKGTVFLAMELLPGETLEDRLVEGERFSEVEALRATRDVASVLAYLRRKGLVHRDLKPGNLLFAHDGSVKLIDLGFAARIGEVEASDTTVGTVAYIAPEQARGEGELDARADIYSLGATLYHLVVGEPPFAGDDNQEVLEKQVFAELSSERIKALGLSPTLHYFIEKMMAKDKAIRFQDADEIVRDIEEKLGDSLESEPTPPPARKQTRTRSQTRNTTRGATRSSRRRRR